MPYKAHLAKDKKLKKLVYEIELEPLKINKNIFIAMVRSIISQQLSTKVASVIFERFLALYNTNNPKPGDVLNTDYDTLKSIGLSNQKTKYIINIAEFAGENDLSFKYLNELDNASLIKYLTQIKGVGQWTVEMLMMFTLGRENVFSTGDYGLQMSMKEIYKLDNTNKKEFVNQINKISEKWEPFQTYASLILWRFRDTK